MVIVDDSKFSERDKLLIRTMIAHARGDVPFSHIRHILDWGTLPPNSKGTEQWEKQHAG